MLFIQQFYLTKSLEWTDMARIPCCPARQALRESNR
ncbi:Uncharacterised protein [Edwardsiella ictaluri]|nr:Uncharacterised protein [Edwardsiella ictaluri]